MSPVIKLIEASIVAAGDSSAPDNTDSAAAPVGDVLQHSQVKREAKVEKVKKGRGGRRNVGAKKRESSKKKKGCSNQRKGKIK